MGKGVMEVWHVNGQDPSILFLGQSLPSPWDSLEVRILPPWKYREDDEQCGLNRPPGSPVPGILQARTLEWVAISFSNA